MAKLLTPADVAERLKVCPRTLDNLAARGALTKIRLGRAVRYRADDVDALIYAGGDR